jgi:hypothetical protein
MYSRENSDETFNLEAKKLAQDAIDECVDLIQFKTNLTSEIKDEITSNLKSLKIDTVFDEVLNKQEYLEMLYDELSLHGNESYIILWRETLRHIKRLENESADKWKIQINNIAKIYLTDVVYDTLCEC